MDQFGHAWSMHIMLYLWTAGVISARATYTVCACDSQNTIVIIGWINLASIVFKNNLFFCINWVTVWGWFFFPSIFSFNKYLLNTLPFVFCVIKPLLQSVSSTCFWLYLYIFALETFYLLLGCCVFTLWNYLRIWILAPPLHRRSA